MSNRETSDPATWDPALDAVTAAPKHHKVLFENDNLRVLEVTLEHEDEEPVHHHRWPSVFVFDQVGGPIHSVYSWEGRLNEDEEWRLTLKFMSDKSGAVETRLRALHPYTTPQWIVVRAEHVGADYLAWAAG